jgi:hypothetical protein
MSRVFTANDICFLALGAIGNFSINDSAPTGTSLRRAREWLDLIMAQLVGTHRMFSRVDDTLSMLITNGTSSYDLYLTLGSSLPTDKIQFVTGAWLEDENGNRSDIEIVTREKFENVDKPAQNGTPIWIYIDRVVDHLTNPTLRIFPTPATTDTKVYTLKLVCQRYAPNVAPRGVTGNAPAGNPAHELSQAWQRWLVTQLAHDLGAGPIQKLPEPSLARFASMAMEAKTALLAFENREQETTPPICASNEPLDCEYGSYSGNHWPVGYFDYGNRR